MSEEKQRYMVLPRTLVFVFKDNKILMMRYSGKGENQSQEKADRKDIYNALGGHIEQGEDIIASAIRETFEEAGVRLSSPRLTGVINVSGFAGKNVMMFLVCGTTDDEIVSATLEGTLEWVDLNRITELSVFDDMKPILDLLVQLTGSQMLVGTSQFDGFKLQKIDLRIV